MEDKYAAEKRYQYLRGYKDDLRFEKLKQEISEMSFYDRYLSPFQQEVSTAAIDLFSEVKDVLDRESNFLKEVRINTAQLHTWRTSLFISVSVAFVTAVAGLVFDSAVVFALSSVGIGFAASCGWQITQTLKDIPEAVNVFSEQVEIEIEHFRRQLIKDLTSPDKWERGDVLVDSSLFPNGIVLQTKTKPRYVEVVIGTDLSPLLKTAIENGHLSLSSVVQADDLVAYFARYADLASDYSLRLTGEDIETWRSHIGSVEKVQYTSDTWMYSNRFAAARLVNTVQEEYDFLLRE